MRRAVFIRGSRHAAWPKEMKRVGGMEQVEWVVSSSARAAATRKKARPTEKHANAACMEMVVVLWVARERGEKG